MRLKMLVLALVIVVILLAAGLAVGAAFSTRLAPAAPAAATDTARLYFPPGAAEFTDLYAMLGHLPLDEWHTVRVFGETFPACALGYDGGETILTVNETARERCGALPGA